MSPLRPAARIRHWPRERTLTVLATPQHDLCYTSVYSGYAAGPACPHSRPSTRFTLGQNCAQTNFRPSFASIPANCGQGPKPADPLRPLSHTCSNTYPKKALASQLRPCHNRLCGRKWTFEARKRLKWGRQSQIRRFSPSNPRVACTQPAWTIREG